MVYQIDTLTAVNAMLGLLNELPVNSLDDDHPLVPAALSKLQMENSFVQADMLWFNTEYPTLHPDPVTKHVRVPIDCASADSLTSFPALSVRGGKLYNQDQGTLEFERPLRVRLHRILPFDDTPLTARQFILCRAKREFQADYDGDQLKMQKLERDIQMARMAMNAEHIRNVKANMFHRSGVQRIINNIDPQLQTSNLGRIL